MCSCLHMHSGSVNAILLWNNQQYRWFQMLTQSIFVHMILAQSSTLGVLDNNTAYKSTHSVYIAYLVWCADKKINQNWYYEVNWFLLTSSGLLHSVLKHIVGVLGEPLTVTSEQDVFDYISMDYKHPHERNMWQWFWPAFCCTFICYAAQFHVFSWTARTCRLLTCYCSLHTPCWFMFIYLLTRSTVIIF